MKSKKVFLIMLAVMLMLTILVACNGDGDSAEVTVAPTDSAGESDSLEDSGELPSPDEILQLQSDARYTFEQMFLPTVVYSTDSDEIIELLSRQDESGMKTLLLDTWEQMVVAFIDFSVTEGNLSTPVARDVLGLGDEHITSVTAEMLTEDTPAFIISMLDIEQFLRSTYIAIVFHNNELQIYTLEQSHGFHMFCFVNLHSRGSFFDVENDRDSFTQAIISVLD